MYIKKFLDYFIIHRSKFLITFTLLLVFMIISIQAACNIDTKPYKYNRQLAPYFHEMTFKDYKQDTDHQTCPPEITDACASVRNGNLIGRNYDHAFDSIPEFVVHVKNNSDHFASVGVASHYYLDEDKLLNNEYDEELELIPNRTFDGINENGVFCNANILEAADTSPLKGTNPDSSEKLFLPFVCRYVLDHAKSADNAIELLQEVNIYGVAGEYTLCFMICDQEKTYIVELIDNQVVAHEKFGSEQIMTNFNQNISYFPENGFGMERYKVLKENYDMSETKDGMFELLKKVRYSLVYTSENPLDYYSEYVNVSTLEDSDFVARYSKWYEAHRIDYNKALEEEDRDAAAENDYELTKHNTIYDIENLKLQLIIEENYEDIFYFKL